MASPASAICSWPAIRLLQDTSDYAVLMTSPVSQCHRVSRLMVTPVATVPCQRVAVSAPCQLYRLCQQLYRVCQQPCGVCHRQQPYQRVSRVCVSPAVSVCHRPYMRVSCRTCMSAMPHVSPAAPGYISASPAPAISSWLLFIDAV